MKKLKLLMLMALLVSCTTGRDFGSDLRYDSWHRAYYPKRFRIPLLLDVQQNAKRSRIKL